MWHLYPFDFEPFDLPAGGSDELLAMSAELVPIAALVLAVALVLEDRPLDLYPFLVKFRGGGGFGADIELSVFLRSLRNCCRSGQEGIRPLLSISHKSRVRESSR